MPSQFHRGLNLRPNEVSLSERLFGMLGDLSQVYSRYLCVYNFEIYIYSWLAAFLLVLLAFLDFTLAMSLRGEKSFNLEFDLFFLTAGELVLCLEDLPIQLPIVFLYRRDDGIASSIMTGVTAGMATMVYFLIGSGLISCGLGDELLR